MSTAALVADLMRLLCKEIETNPQLEAEVAAVIDKHFAKRERVEAQQARGLDALMACDVRQLIVEEGVAGAQKRLQGRRFTKAALQAYCAAKGVPVRRKNPTKLDLVSEIIFANQPSRAAAFFD